MGLIPLKERDSFLHVLPDPVFSCGKEDGARKGAPDWLVLPLRFLLRMAEASAAEQSELAQLPVGFIDPLFQPFRYVLVRLREGTAGEHPGKIVILSDGQFQPGVNVLANQ